MAFDAITKILYLLFFIIFLKFEIILGKMFGYEKQESESLEVLFLVIEMSLDVMTLFGMFCFDFSWKSLILLWMIWCWTLRTWWYFCPWVTYNGYWWMKCLTCCMNRLIKFDVYIFEISDEFSSGCFVFSLSGL